MIGDVRKAIGHGTVMGFVVPSERMIERIENVLSSVSAPTNVTHSRNGEINCLWGVGEKQTSICFLNPNEFSVVAEPIGEAVRHVSYDQPLPQKVFDLINYALEKDK